MAYASISDVMVRLKRTELDEQETALAEALLEDAAALLDTIVAVDEGSVTQARLLLKTNADMVVRAMATSEDTMGADEVTWGMGPFSHRTHLAGAVGDLYLTGNERKALLRVSGRGRARMLVPESGVCHEPPTV